MRIAFMGTPEFGAESLRRLIEAGHQVICVFTQPDRPSGRGNKMVPSPVKQVATENGIPVHQPLKISRECAELLRSYAPDACVTAAFGQFLSEELLAIPKYGTINVHASLLPKHRGSAPINWAIINGEAQTGVTTMYTVRKMDAGDILLKEETKIEKDETAGELTVRLAKLGAELLIETLRRIEEGTCPRIPQNEDEMTYEPMLQKENGRIDWQKTANEIHSLIRGVSPWPGAFTMIGQDVFKLWKADVVQMQGEAGQILYGDAKEGLVICCGKDALRVTELQAPGGKRMLAKDYFRGHSLTAAKAGE